MFVNNEEYYHIDYNNNLQIGEVYNTKENGLYEELYNGECSFDGKDAIEILNAKRKSNDTNLSVDELNLIYNTLGNQAFVTRELMFEKVRKEVDESLPSRLKCLFVCKDLEEIKLWIDILKRNKKEDYKVYKVKLDGKIFCGNASLVLRQTVSLDKKIEQARKYWSSNNNSNLMSEYLFEGKFEVVERIDDVC